MVVEDDTKEYWVAGDCKSVAVQATNDCKSAIVQTDMCMFSFGVFPSLHVIKELASELQEIKQENRKLKDYVAKQKLENKMSEKCFRYRQTCAVLHHVKKLLVMLSFS